MEGIAMARTYRRRKVPHCLIRSLAVWVRLDSGACRLMRLDPRDTEGKQALARYRADGGFGNIRYACPPRWYRHQLNRRDDRREQQDLHTWLRSPEHDVLPRRWGRDAKWYW